tara:strand:- start:14355 stop:15422 length:1068 start_codon:yes stop_codon:yes gene_type:complete
MNQKKTKILIVDDSAIIRKLLRTIFEKEPTFEVIGAAPDPYIARDMIARETPDVMTLDIEMPKMDGIAFLEKIMAHHPIRTVIISSLSKAGSEIAMRAFEVGAVDVIEKPSIDVNTVMMDNGRTIIEKVKQVAKANVSQIQPKRTYRSIAKTNISSGALEKTTHQILAVASSTGGTETLKEIFTKLPADIPGTVIVQHMPPGFTKTYAESLNKICPFNVKEAEENDTILPGHVYLAPGNFHMRIKRVGGFYKIRLSQEPHIHGVRPAADLLMESVAKEVGANAIGLIVTGMGKDGAQGLLKMKEAGSFNIAQDEKTCVVYGMPREAFEVGAIHTVASLGNIPNELIKQFKARAVS